MIYYISQLTPDNSSIKDLLCTPLFQFRNLHNNPQQSSFIYLTTTTRAGEMNPLTKTIIATGASSGLVTTPPSPTRLIPPLLPSLTYPAPIHTPYNQSNS